MRAKKEDPKALRGTSLFFYRESFQQILNSTLTHYEQRTQKQAGINRFFIFQNVLHPYWQI